MLQLNLQKLVKKSHMLERQSVSAVPLHFFHFFCKCKVHTKKEWQNVKIFWPPQLKNLKFVMLWPQLLRSISNCVIGYYKYEAKKMVTSPLLMLHQHMLELNKAWLPRLVYNNNSYYRILKPVFILHLHTPHHTTSNHTQWRRETDMATLCLNWPSRADSVKTEHKMW